MVTDALSTSIFNLSKIIPGGHGLMLDKFVHTLKAEAIPLEIVDMSGRIRATASQGVRHRLLIRDRRFFNALISPNAFSLGEAYIRGYFDISGNIRELYEMVCQKMLSTEQPRRFSQFLSTLAAPFVTGGFDRDRERERRNIAYHYDVQGGFYRLFLGRTMGYTCGYYPGDTASMSEAQEEKLDIICRKLRLIPGDRLLDIGCGWGNFLVYASKHYGVRAIGITLSREQKAYAEDWVCREGLEALVNIRICNYRDLEASRFDKIVCIGMSEHVGKKNMRHFYGVVNKCLKPGGLFLQHTITTYIRQKKGYTNRFLETYMFPGGELMREQDLVDQAADSGLELLTAENFRPHYIRTLADWISRMEANREKILEIVPESVFRIYHVFFIGSLISFRDKKIALFQNLFHKSSDMTDRSIVDDRYFTTPYSKHEQSFIGK